MPKYISDRVRNLNIGIPGYTETDTVLSVTGISTFSSLLDINGDINIDASQIEYNSAGNYLKFADNAQLRFGGGNDLRIYHDGLNSYIDDAGDGVLAIRSNSVRLQKYTGEEMVQADADGSVSLYYDNAKKFETTSSGIQIYGTTVAATSAVISGPDEIVIDPATVGDNTGTVIIKGDLQIDGTTTTVNSTTVTIDDKNIVLASGAANAAAADDGGITIDGASATILYKSTPDAWSFNKNVGINTTAPDSELHVKGDTNSTLILEAVGANDSRIWFADAFSNNPGVIEYDHNLNKLIFGTTDGTADVTIDGSGLVGIGNNSPSYSLDVNGSIRAVDATAPKIIVADNVNNQRFIFGYDQSRAGHNLGSKILADGLNIGYYTRLTQNGSHIFYTNDNGSDAERLRITSSGNVGIGTASPSFPLVVQSDVNSVSAIFKIASVTATTGYHFAFGWADNSLYHRIRTAGGSNDGFIIENIDAKVQQYFAANGDWSLFNDGNASLVTTPGGDLFVDRSSQLTDAKVSINADAGEALIAGQMGTNTGISTVLQTYNSSGTITSNISVDNALNRIILKGGTTSGVLVSDVGYVGINGTTDPNVELHILTTPAAAGNSGRIGFGDISNNRVAQIEAYREGGSFAGSLIFRTQESVASNSEGIERLRITSAGNVGIGTDSPTATLELSKEANHGIKLSRPVGGVNPGDFDITVSSNGAGNISADRGVYLTFGQDGLNNQEFSIISNTTQVGVFNATGLGLKTSAPTQTLDVNGGARFRGAVYDGSNSAGTSGQILVSNGTSTSWTSGSSLSNVNASTITVATESTDNSTYLIFANDVTGDVAPKTSGNLIYDSVGLSLFVPKVRVNDFVAHQANANIAVKFFNTGTNSTDYLGLTADSSSGHSTFRVYGQGSVVERMRIASDGNVGIRNSSPSYELDVTGSIKASSQGRFGTGSQGAPSYSFDGDSNTGMYRGGIDTLAFSTAGTERMTINADGSVDIGSVAGTVGVTYNLEVQGSTPPDEFSGQLSVRGTETTGAADTGGGIVLLGHDGSNARTWGYIRGFKENGTSGNTASYLSFATRANGGNPTEKVRITSAGNFGIGLTAPSTALHVSRDLGTGSNLATFHNSSVTYSQQLYLGFDASKNIVWSGGSTNGGVIWDLGTLGYRWKINGTQIAHLNSTGLGIGTASPSYALDTVNADVRIAGLTIDQQNSGTPFSATQISGAFNNRLYFAATHLNAGYGVWLRGRDVGNTGFDAIDESGGQYGLRIYSNNAERIRVSNAGNVGINTTSPTQKLEVNGTALATTLSTGASGTGINISTDTISGPATLTIDPAAVGDNTGLVVIKGDLQIDGTTTTINSTTVNVDDLNLTLASGAANAAAADGGGITLDGASASITYASTGDQWVFNKAPYYNTNRLLTTADEGSGNGLDADTLDGLDSTQFLRSDADDSTSGQITITRANNTGAAGGQIRLNGATGNRIDWNQNGVAAPAFTTKSVGTKLVLYPALSASQVDYALGIENSTLWYSVPTTSQNHKWYGGTTEMMKLTNSVLTVGGNTVWNAGNDGAGSTLDADTVDGLQASQFLRSDTADTASGVITFSSDINVADKIVHDGDTNTAIRFPAADTFTVETSGTEQFRVDAVGNIGIGKTPQVGLDIDRQKLRLGKTTGGNCVIEAFTGTTSAIGIWAGGSPYLYSTGNLTISTGATTTTTGVPTAKTDAVVINSDGRVGIGTGNASEGYLEVKSGTAPFFNIKATDYSDGSGVFIGSVDAGGYKYIAGDSYYYNSSLWRSKTTESAIINLNDGLIRFYANSGLTANSNFTPSEKMRITPTGDVGIGTTGPQARLHLRLQEDTAKPVLYVHRANNSAGGAGNEEIGIEVDIPFTYNSAGTVYGVKSYVRHNLGAAHYAGYFEAYGNPYSNGIGVYAKTTHTDTNGPGAQSAIYADAYSTIGTSNAGYCIGITSRTNDYINNQNLVLQSDYTGSSDQTAVRITRNGVNVGNIKTSQTNTSYYTSTTSGLVGNSTHELSLYTNSNERIRVTSTGDVGIGTNNPSGRLEVYNGDAYLSNNIYLSGGVGNTYKPVNVGVNDIFLNTRHLNAGYGVWVRSSNAGDRRIGIEGSINDLLLYSNSTEKVRIKDSGNVGVGTSNPSTLLHLRGGAATATIDSSTNTAYVNFINTTTTGYFGLANNDLNLVLGGTERARITSAGNVGIATTAPTEKLEVTGNIKLSSNGTGNSASSYDLLFYGTSSTAVQKNQAKISSSPWTSNTNAGVLKFFTNSSVNVVTERMVIDGDGNVGIATSSPAYKLEVNGSFAATTKSFVIDHPTKEGKKLRYGSLEGPENGVYVRGKSTEFVIELPEYWTKLVDEDSITVNLTAIGKSQSLWVKDIKDNKIYIGSKCTTVKYFYTVFGERIDVEKLEVEY